MIPRLLIIAERGYCPDTTSWVTTIDRLWTILPKYPTVSLQVRNKLSTQDWTTIEDRLRRWVDLYPEQCILNGTLFPDLTMARHLPENTLYAKPHNYPLWGTSIHSLEALHRAESMKVDYLQYGAIFPTSKPVTPLGLPALQNICTHSSLPVLAVGGINTVQRVGQCLKQGAYGLSVGSWILQASDPEPIIEQILSEIDRHSL